VLEFWAMRDDGPVFGSTEEVNGAAEEEDHASKVGFGLGDGYDKSSGAGEITVDESIFLLSIINSTLIHSKLNTGPDR